MPVQRFAVLQLDEHGVALCGREEAQWQLFIAQLASRLRYIKVST